MIPRVEVLHIVRVWISSHRIASWSNCLCLVGFPIASSTVVAVDQTRHMDHILIFPHEDRSQGSSASTRTEERKISKNKTCGIHHELNTGHLTFSLLPFFPLCPRYTTLLRNNGRSLSGPERTSADDNGSAR
ncbi:hypothetical protein BO86DRAFT_385146 [Aspergillus japonicus CBS 114.51]|uniref:Uncharacterized protein n=1 Tax=Aspergillus japonicus CBS 114.51 TaxID=1448312 RepID=A0A8T8XFS5_ASPJA|nr:hypothetical protein BO86DRAFT_385146 [Aspergillus japonicus CBS 114.51]RAH87157.1 hypothetical protein BO86DRAFT_385146 [Aspergillus japonicus CBS 114.51]